MATPSRRHGRRTGTTRGHEVVVTIHDPAGAWWRRGSRLRCWPTSGPSQATRIAPRRLISISTPQAPARRKARGSSPCQRLNASAEAGAYRAAWWHLRKKAPGRPSSDSRSRGKHARCALQIGIVDQRPRLALLGGFAAVNVIIIAAICKRAETTQRRQRALILSQAYGSINSTKQATDQNRSRLWAGTSLQSAAQARDR